MRRRGKAIILVGALLGVLSCCSFAQVNGDLPRHTEGFIVDSWGVEQGLPGSSVISIVQTREGYLWMGTLYGLVRFDGIQFTVFDEVNTPALGSSRIVHLFEDRASRLWIGTENSGVVLVADGETRGIGLGDSSSAGPLVSAAEDSSGAVWLLTARGQLGRYADGQFETVDVSYGLPGTFRSVLPGAGNTLWVGLEWLMFSIARSGTLATNPVQHLQTVPVPRLDLLLESGAGGFWRLGNRSIQLWEGNTVQRDLGSYPWAEQTLVTSACEDEDGNLIVGTRHQAGADEEGGVYWFGQNGMARRISTSNGLSDNSVLSVCVDREGNLWVGTDGGGLNRVRRSSFRTVPGTESWVVQSVCEDRQEAIWIGANQGHVGRLQARELQEFTTVSQAVKPSVRSVFADRDNGIWVGTWGGGLFTLSEGELTRFTGLPGMNPIVHAIAEGSDGTLWFGTAGGLTGWNRATRAPVPGWAGQSVRAIVEDNEGRLWLGTDGAGLVCLDDTKVTLQQSRPDGLPSDNVSALLLDEDGVLWIGTPGAGLVRLHQGQWTHFTTAQGLTANGIGYLIEDNEDHLWLGSNAGLMRILKRALNELAAGRIQDLPVRTYGEAEGLPSRECTMGSQPGAWRGHDGQLWFPTTRGLVTVDPARIRTNPHPPPIVIETVRVDGNLHGSPALGTSPPAAVTLNPSEERLEIYYASLNLAAPQRTRFRYRMEGHETAWTEVLDTRVVRYSKLPPGEYRFHVTAANEDGVWNATGTGLAVIVEPPFWQTWWFVSAATLTLLGLVIGVVHFISTQKLQREVAALREKEALERERSRIARDLHDQLGANLTQVALLGELAETDKDVPEEVEDHARQISQTARETTRALDEIVWAANPSNDTLEGLINYTCKYAQEYLAIAGLRYRLEVPPAPPDCPLPPELRHNVFLAAKEAVNNVVKHAQATEARLRLHLTQDGFVIEVEDDGRGPGEIESERARTRQGLRNMRRRMEDVGGTFEIEPAGKRGTVVRLTAPLRQV